MGRAHLLHGGHQVLRRPVQGTQNHDREGDDLAASGARLESPADGLDRLIRAPGTMQLVSDPGEFPGRFIVAADPAEKILARRADRVFELLGLRSRLYVAL